MISTLQHFNLIVDLTNILMASAIRKGMIGGYYPSVAMGTTSKIPEVSIQEGVTHQ